MHGFFLKFMNFGMPMEPILWASGRMVIMEGLAILVLSTNGLTDVLLSMCVHLRRNSEVQKYTASLLMSVVIIWAVAMPESRTRRQVRVIPFQNMVPAGAGLMATIKSGELLWPIGLEKGRSIFQILRWTIMEFLQGTRPTIMLGSWRRWWIRWPTTVTVFTTNLDWKMILSLLSVITSWLQESLKFQKRFKESP